MRLPTVIAEAWGRFANIFRHEAQNPTNLPVKTKEEIIKGCKRGK
jgi:hypothetical protein